MMKPKELCLNLVEKYFTLEDKWKAAGVPSDVTIIVPLDEYYDIARTGKTIDIRDNRTGARLAKVKETTFSSEVGSLFERYLTIYYGREP